MSNRFCEVHFRPYPATHSGCVLCYQSKAKSSRTSERETQKQESIKAKQKERNSEPKQVPKQVSKKQASEAAELAKIKREFLATHPYCFTTGEYVTAETCDLSHIIPRGNKKFVTERLNLVLEKREPHLLWEHYKAAYANQHPVQWAQKLERAKQLSETHYQQLKDKAE